MRLTVRRAGALASLAVTAFFPGAAAAAATTGEFGPFNLTLLEGGIGDERGLPADAAAAAGAAAPWSLHGWVYAARRQPGAVILAAVGDSAASSWRGLQLDDGVLEFAAAPGVTLRGSSLAPGHWVHVAATYDGRMARLYVDGAAVAAAAADAPAVAPRLALAPAAADAAIVGVDPAHFGGSLAMFTLSARTLPAADVAALAHARPDFALVTFTRVGAGWPLQAHAWRGLLVPQDPWTLPHSAAAAGTARAVPAPAEGPALRMRSTDRAALVRWRLAPAPAVEADPVRLSDPAYVERRQDWYDAVVPGTVLTTLIERGVYPDPDHGLDNLAIPDTLSRQDYWYRSVFPCPPGWDGLNVSLDFAGINYRAEVWMNGHRLGAIRGAFTRGRFDVGGVLRPGSNAIAVRIAPPPHPGIPHEQSIAAGPGENGGALALDGPTFIATEGWDWIPGIRDRNTGLWQGVELHATGTLRLGDVHVTSHLPLPSTDSADLDIDVPVENRLDSSVAGRLVVRLDGPGAAGDIASVEPARAGSLRAGSVRAGSVRVEKQLRFEPGLHEIRLRSSEFPQLHLDRPRLWWPNGYGEPDLYTLTVEVAADGDIPGVAGRRPSDRAALRVGIRELTYELSLFDHAGRLRRVEVDPAASGERLVDGRHAAINQTPGGGWAQSLTAAGEVSSAVRSAASQALTPYLVIKVNGVPIAARGGSWGMDDSRKRVARERLEPYFRLHRDAHLNIIRNWLGQDTEEAFYDLADQYGLLVLNDFWVSTQDFQLEPEDPVLFLANARDVIGRYRNHPSIAVWFGRNEGVPQPILNEGLADLVAGLDGTRLYTGSSNSVNLQGSGPYDYRPPERYFTDLARGFSVEVGTPSLSTLEALEASIPAADRWPLGDTYAYHDWHHGGNGDVASFMSTLAERYGAGTDLADFERKAQLMNYETYRAIFEGFAAHLWTRNSGRLLWMTHPSWPSNAWQIYSSDMDTGAAYYAVKKACEPVHVQLNLPDWSLAVVNTTRESRPGLTLRARVIAADGRLLTERVEPVDAAANATTTLAPLAALPGLLEREGLVFVTLSLAAADGSVLSTNAYWPSRTAADQHRLNDLPRQTLVLTARAAGPAPVGGIARAGVAETRVLLRVENRNAVPVLGAKLTVQDAAGLRVLPAYYSDNYLTLMPGESRDLELRCPAAAGAPRCNRVALRGWNVVPAVTQIH